MYKQVQYHLKIVEYYLKIIILQSDKIQFSKYKENIFFHCQVIKHKL